MIIKVEGEEQIESIRGLFLEYEQSLPFSL